MSQIGCSNSDKQRFDELQPEDSTQKEFFSTVLDAYANRDEKVIIDTEKIVEELTTQTAANVELAAYRGVKEAIEETVIE